MHLPNSVALARLAEDAYARVTGERDAPDRMILLDAAVAIAGGDGGEDFRRRWSSIAAWILRELDHDEGLRWMRARGAGLPPAVRQALKSRAAERPAALQAIEAGVPDDALPPDAPATQADLRQAIQRSEAADELADFGLQALAVVLTGLCVRAGTPPPWGAPEQGGVEVVDLWLEWLEQTFFAEPVCERGEEGGDHANG